MLNIDDQNRSVPDSTQAALPAADVHSPDDDNLDTLIRKILSNTGSWSVNQNGIQRISPRGKLEIACYHEILPIGRSHDITTGTVKLKLAFRRSAQPWETITVDKRTLASSRSIISLADFGISVTSNSAAYLVEYINDMYELNYGFLEYEISVSHLGYIPKTGFAPYSDTLSVNVDESYRTIFSAIQEHGNLEEWFHAALECRQMSTAVRIMLAGSFASPLVSVVGALPFFVHVWGVDSGTGKTVSLMLAASIWGDPEPGRYIQTHNGTRVGHERFASFLHHMPLCIDELQLASNGKRAPHVDVYQLAEGVGKSRGRSKGGVEITPTWSCTILSTGESPIVTPKAGSGAVNRVIEIETEPDHYIIRDGNRIANALKRNYGFAGKMFVTNLFASEATIANARNRFENNYNALLQFNATDKQAMAGAILMTADQLATKWIFRDNLILTAEDLRPYLVSKVAVSAGKRAYDWLCGWIAANSNHFHRGTLPPSGITYGMIDNDIAYIIRPIFDQVLLEAGFSPAATLSYLRANNLIIFRENKGYTKSKRINGISIDCVWMIYQKGEHT